MKKLEKELQETEAVESQQKKAKLVSVKREFKSLFLTVLQTHAQYMVWVTKSLSDEWTNKQINKMNDLIMYQVLKGI